MNRPITFGGRFCDYDYIEEDSDQEGGRDSSDDEIDLILHGTPEQKRKLSRSLSHGSLDVSSSSEDEFEKDMEQELEESLQQHELHNSAQEAGQGPSSDGKPKDPAVMASSMYYDDIYFDSDEEEDGVSGSKAKPATNGQATAKKQKTKHRIPTNEELFYDPEIDEDNQKWVNKQRSYYHASTSGKKSSVRQQQPESSSSEMENPILPPSDAILNCPACLTTLCLDCQRHELYPTQYRAMFVLNCEIIRSERLKYAAGKPKGRKWKKRKINQPQNDENGKPVDKAQSAVVEGAARESTMDTPAPSGGTAPSGKTTPSKETTPRVEAAPVVIGAPLTEEFYHPVKCSVCTTEVAVYDKDEVFHFFNVLTSIS